jgi:perosamine synthetase
MIPRARPSYHWADLRDAWHACLDAVERFESALATYFNLNHAIVFPYGRSAIYTCLRALGQPGGEVVQPAYNCVVVAHATMCAGHRPVFVDAQSHSPNQDPEAIVERVHSTTVAVMPTSIFGLSFEAKALCEAIRQRNPKALILLDCCQAFDACWHGERLASQGDAALLAFGLGKPMTTLYGGALLTNRDDLAQAVRQYRHTTFRTPGRAAALRRWSYFLGSWLALLSPCVRLTDWLEHVDTPLHRYLLTLRAREAIRLPADHDVLMLPLEAAIGRTQLQRVAGFMHRRREIAAIYSQALGNVPGLELLPWTDGASYAIYAVRLQQPAQRQHVLKIMRQSGVQGDTVLSYVIPSLACYRAQGYTGKAFPQAVAWSQSVLNLPNHPTMSDKQVWRVVRAVREALGESCD